jgi:hypothetical protein
MIVLIEEILITSDPLDKFRNIEIKIIIPTSKDSTIILGVINLVLIWAKDK